jgi:serine/threonine protein kinase
MWIKGELIGKGTFGRVYLALNTTTGEMIAVKEVGLPKTANDKNDSHQLRVVEDLTAARDMLINLDHPNIEYLGFEQSVVNLNMCVATKGSNPYLPFPHSSMQFSYNMTQADRSVAICESMGSSMRHTLRA